MCETLLILKCIFTEGRQTIQTESLSKKETVFTIGKKLICLTTDVDFIMVTTPFSKFHRKIIGKGVVK